MLRRRPREDEREEDLDEDFLEEEAPVRPRPTIALLNPISAAAARRKHLISLGINLAVFLVPILATALYLAFIAKPLYEVESIIMVKMPPSMGGGGGPSGGGAAGGLSALIGKVTGGSSVMPRAIDESFAVMQYIASREAFRELEKRIAAASVPEAAVTRAAAAAVSSTPAEASTAGAIAPKAPSEPAAPQAPAVPANAIFGSWYGLSADTDFETRFSYYLSNVKLVYDEITGQVDLKTYAYDAASANLMNEILLQMSEDLVNQFNLRSERDFLDRVRKEVDKTRNEYNAAAAAVTQFRLSNNMIDPKLDGAALGGIITGLLTSATGVEAEISNMIGRGVTNEAQLRPLRTRLAALQDQIEAQKAQLTGQNGSLAPVMAQYAVLDMNQQIAQQQYVSALSNLSSATFQASAQKLYIVNIVPPKPPEEAQYPDTQRTLLLAVLFSALGLLVFRTAVSGVRDHMM